MFLSFQPIKAQELVEVKPIGGDQFLKSFINQIFEYPADLYNKQLQGAVSFLFEVDEDGVASNIHNIESFHPDALKETLRVFKLIEWSPATRGGKPIKYLKRFTLEFNIKKFDRLVKSRGYINMHYPFDTIDSTNIVHWYRHLDHAPYPIKGNQQINLPVFIASNLNYPEAAIRQNVTGVVKLNFIVETFGKVSNVQTTQSVGAGCTEEAVRLLTMTNWMPGILDGKAVRTRTNISINFQLDKNGNRFEPVIKSSYGE
jgi:TonB family protein